MASITRIKHIKNVLYKSASVKICLKSRHYVSVGKVTIGNIEKEVTKAKRPEYVPINYCR